MNLRRLKWVAIIVPGVLTAGLVGGLHSLFPVFAMSMLGHSIQLMLIALGSYAFSQWVFGLVATGEARILRRSAQLQELNEVALSISKQMSLDSVLQEVTLRSRSLVGARYSALQLMARDGRPPRTIAADSAETTAVAQFQPPAEVLATVWKTAAPVRLQVAYPLLCVPVLVRGQILGLLYLRTPEAAKEFSADDEQIVMMLANLAATAIERTTLFDQVQQTSQYLERLIAGSQDAIVALATDGRVQLWNRGAETLYGLPAEVAMGQVLPMVPEAERVSYLERLLQGTTGVREEQHVRADGSEVPVIVTHSRVEPLAGQGPTLLMSTKDMTAHHRLEAQRRRLALLEERERIGMDLHDGAIQALYAIGLGLQATARMLPPDTQGVREKLEQAAAQLSTVIQDLRSYILDLRPPGLPGRSLGEGLLSLADRLREEAGIEVTRSIAQCEVGVSPDVAVQLLHVAGEAVSNIIRHSGATAAHLELKLTGGRLTLILRDNGCGLSAGGALPPERRGLRNMKARAALMGGECTVTGAPGGGTEIRVVVPLDG